MSIYKSEFIAFRVKPKQKEMLRNIANKEERHLSEVLRKLIRKKIRNKAFRSQAHLKEYIKTLRK